MSDMFKDAWVAVWDALKIASPGFYNKNVSGQECAVTAINELASKLAAEKARGERLKAEKLEFAQRWRNDAMEAAAQIAVAYGVPACADDISAMCKPVSHSIPRAEPEHGKAAELCNCYDGAHCRGYPNCRYRANAIQPTTATAATPAAKESFGAYHFQHSHTGDSTLRAVVDETRCAVCGRKAGSPCPYPADYKDGCLRDMSAADSAGMPLASPYSSADKFPPKVVVVPWADYQTLRQHAESLANEVKTLRIMKNNFMKRALAAESRVGELEKDAARYMARRMNEYHLLTRNLPEGHTTTQASVYHAYDAHSDWLPQCPEASLPPAKGDTK